MKAIAFLVAAFVILAACNRPMTADRAVGVAERTDATSAQRAKRGEQAPFASEAPVADPSVTEKVREALIAERGLTARDLEISTKDGVVTLLGTIEERSDRDRMMLVAGSIEGVRSVVSKLVLDGSS